MADVSAAQKALADLGVAVQDIIGMVKAGGGIGEVGKAIGLLKDLHVLVADAKLALPELKGLDAEEAALLAESAYQAVQAVLKSLA